MKYPKMVRIRQNFKTNPIKDIPATVRSELAEILPQTKITRGDTVAITAGSRGITNLAAVLGEIIRELKKVGAKPFIIPAMGSHGGATPEGQKKILEHYGITKKSMGVPVKSSLSVVQISTTPDGIPVFMDRNASKADHIVVVNRVKPHTDFKGKFESGLMKMMCIGLGKQKGADHYHNVIVRRGHYAVFLSVAREILKRCPVAFGVALVENQRDETQIIRAIPAAEIETTEYQLLRKAKRLFPRIPVNPIDLLIVDQMGKEISGTGMDQNVIGRSVIPYHRPSARNKIQRIFVRDLTADSEGNATAIGNADFTTKRLVKKIDHQATYMNAVTSSCPEAVRIPPYYDSDREAIDTALKTIGPVEPQNAAIVHILDTLRLEEMDVSEVMLPDVEKIRNLSVVGSPRLLKFDPKGNLISKF
ncbi:MAG: lactate racemase domain-containing protein [Desulfobacterales bacterium]|jgi:hypothetical protein